MQYKYNQYGIMKRNTISLISTIYFDNELDAITTAKQLINKSIKYCIENSIYSIGTVIFDENDIATPCITLYAEVINSTTNQVIFRSDSNIFEYEN